jgi:hypothetical protein
MNLLAYIQGNRKGKEAHRIEKEAMRDPFLADALEGYDAVKADHSERITHLRHRIVSKPTFSFLHIGIAASLLLCLSIGGYYLLNKQSDNLIAMSVLSKNKAAEENHIEDAEIPFAEIAIPEPVTEPDVQSGSRQQIVEAPSTVASVDRMNQMIFLTEDILSVIEDEQQLPQQEINIADDEKEVAAGITEMEDFAEADALNKAVEEVTRPVAVSRARSLYPETAKLSVPEPEMGTEAYQKYLKEAMLPLQDEECAQKKGVVEVEFTIKAGIPTDFIITQSLCDAADKEAIRLIATGCKWTGEDGQKVVLKVSINE